MDTPSEQKAFLFLRRQPESPRAPEQKWEEVAEEEAPASAFFGEQQTSGVLTPSHSSWQPCRARHGLPAGWGRHIQQHFGSPGSKAWPLVGGWKKARGGGVGGPDPSRQSQMSPGRGCGD